MTTFLLRMSAVYGLLYVGYFAVPDAFLREQVYAGLFGAPSAAIISTLSGDEVVSVMGNRLSSPRATLEIVRGCDGSGVLFMMTAAVLAFPASGAARLRGLLSGSVLVYVLNVFRLVALFVVAVHRPAWFLPLHAYFIPSLLVASVALFYLRWLRLAAPHPER